MSYFLALLFLGTVIFILFSYGRHQENTISKHKSQSVNSKSVKPKRKTVKQEARIIVSKIKTYSEFLELSKEHDVKDHMLGRYLGDEELERECEILDEAIEMLLDKKFRYCCEISAFDDLNIPLRRLNMVGMVVPKEDFARFKELSDFYKGDWRTLENGEDPEPLEDNFCFVKEFRKIVENKRLSEKKIRVEIDNLVFQNSHDASWFFDLDSDEKPSVQWFDDLKD